MEYLVHSLRYTMSGRRLEAVELPEAPSQRKPGHIVLVELLCATALGHIVLVEHYEALGQFVLVEHHGALIVEHIVALGHYSLVRIYYQENCSTL